PQPNRYPAPKAENFPSGLLTGNRSASSPTSSSNGSILQAVLHSLSHPRETAAVDLGPTIRSSSLPTFTRPSIACLRPAAANLSRSPKSIHPSTPPIDGRAFYPT